MHLSQRPCRIDYHKDVLYRVKVQLSLYQPSVFTTNVRPMHKSIVGPEAGPIMDGVVAWMISSETF